METFYEHYPAAGGIKEYLEESCVEPTHSAVWTMNIFARGLITRSFVQSLLCKIASHRERPLNEEFPPERERQAFPRLFLSPAYIQLRKLRPELPDIQSKDRRGKLTPLLMERGFSPTDVRRFIALIRSSLDLRLNAVFAEKICQEVFQSEMHEIFDPLWYGEGAYSGEFREKHFRLQQKSTGFVPLTKEVENSVFFDQSRPDPQLMERVGQAVRHLKERQRMVFLLRNRLEDTVVEDSSRARISVKKRSLTQVMEITGAKSKQAVDNLYRAAEDNLRIWLGIPPRAVVPRSYVKETQEY